MALDQSTLVVSWFTNSIRANRAECYYIDFFAPPSRDRRRINKVSYRRKVLNENLSLFLKTCAEIVLLACFPVTSLLSRYYGNRIKKDFHQRTKYLDCSKTL